MSTRLSQARTSREAGFTLVELLVVVVILGILAAVVVFAVRGSGDDAQDAALKTDERIIRTAEEAYCANQNRYAPMGSATEPETLVGDKYLSEPSKSHDVTASNTPPTGPCNGWSYKVEPKPGVGGNATTTTSTSPPPACTTTTGCWTDIAAPPEPYSNVEFLLPPSGGADLFGRVLSAHWEVGESRPAGAQLYNPDGTWVTAPYPLCSTGPSNPSCAPFRIDAAVNLKGPAEVCGANCGKVLLYVKAHTIGDPTPPRWALYDPVSKVVVNTGPSPYTPDYGGSTTLLWSAACDAASRPAWCGKVLAAGGADSDFPLPPSPLEPRGAQLYDPRSNSWLATGELSSERASHLSSILPDGQVLAVGGSRAPGTAEIYDPETESWGPTVNRPLHRHAIGGAGLRRSGSLVLADGRVLLAGGDDGSGPNGPSTPEAEVFNPQDGSFTSVAGCECRSVSLTLLPDGRVLVVRQGGTGPGKPHPARLLNAQNLSFTEAGSSVLGHGGTVITGGKVLFVSSLHGPFNRAQLYTPPPA